MRKQENVIITGASAGVGRAVANLFASKGAAVGLIARNLKRLQSAADEVKQSGGRALVLPADVSNTVQVESAAERFVREFGSIDIWVNCAMTTIYGGKINTIEPDEFRRITEVTYLGYVYGTQSALKWMVPQRSGNIVQVGSILAYRSIPLQSPYCGAKH
ncbi:MAG: SDR family NAD(P)-dependent oxidoreductase, partial [Fibrobacter sp.]|nr:SDR family NAD(P)-dependent oxidoreductase [Fibrobacter sp.]